MTSWGACLECARSTCNLGALGDQAGEDMGIGPNANTRHGNKLVSYPLSCIVGNARRTPTKNRHGKGAYAPREAPLFVWGDASRVNANQRESAWCVLAA